LAQARSKPKDITGNGITVGHPKAFDNRSLALRVERLSASLANLKVVNQNFTDNLSALQQQSTVATTNSLTLGVKATPPLAPGPPAAAPAAAAAAAGQTAEAPANPGSTVATGKPAAPAEAKPGVALAAGDVLSDQLNLASQILNLETLYERSLSDRLFDGGARLQTVLGFQVSITAPPQFENCAAIVEIAVRLKPPDEVPPAGEVEPAGENGSQPVSLVALIPQEKTYNAQTISSTANSIGGSAVASVFTLGFNRHGESRQMFIHRDSDTIAFERDSASTPQLFGEGTNATVFGWEFRPVLGRKTVAAGTRQMLAVIAVNAGDKGAPAATRLQVKTRTSWRRYHAKNQTTSFNWRWMPWAIDGSQVVESEATVDIPNTAQIQDSLNPKIEEIRWVNSGPGRATIIVRGENFFSGTRVVIGGQVRREDDGSLTLKSHRTLEFDTDMSVLANGDAVLSGRFGASTQLKMPEDKRPVVSLYMARANIKPFRFTKSFLVTVDIKGKDINNEPMDLTLDDLMKLPEAIMFVGSEPIPMPYDYTDMDPSRPLVSFAQQEPLPASTEDNKRFVQIAAWIPAATLVKHNLVAFRIPFCGIEYQTSTPVSFSEPTITRMGTDGLNTVFRIAHPLGLGDGLTVELDKTYSAGMPELTRSSKLSYRFCVPTQVVSSYQSLVVAPANNIEPYLLAIPGEERPKVKTTIKPGKPAEIATSSAGPVEWTGTGLDAIVAVNLLVREPSTLPDPPPPQPVRADFAAYNDGQQLVVYFPEASTKLPGRADVEFQTQGGDSIKSTIFIKTPATSEFPTG
jgi:hypothetical protein